MIQNYISHFSLFIIVYFPQAESHLCARQQGKQLKFIVLLVNINKWNNILRFKQLLQVCEKYWCILFLSLTYFLFPDNLNFAWSNKIAESSMFRSFILNVNKKTILHFLGHGLTKFMLFWPFQVKNFPKIGQKMN